MLLKKHRVMITNNTESLQGISVRYFNVHSIIMSFVDPLVHDSQDKIIMATYIMLNGLEYRC
jgi:hypothetical protein